MPQIYVIIDSKSDASLGGKLRGEQLLCQLGDFLISAVEKDFEIEGKNDVAFTVVVARATMNEASVQVEVRYTAGEDEYGCGRPFDPTLEQQLAVAKSIKGVFCKWAHSNNLHSALWFPSVWCKPYYKGHFETP